MWLLVWLCEMCQDHSCSNMETQLKKIPEVSAFPTVSHHSAEPLNTPSPLQAGLATTTMMPGHTAECNDMQGECAYWYCLAGL